MKGLVLFVLLSCFGVREMFACEFSQPPLVATPSGEHTGTLIFLHGLGDTGAGWFDSLLLLRKENPTLRIVCPTAPLQRVTLNRGMSMTAWHDIASLDSLEGALAGIEQCSKLISELIKSESEMVPTNKIVLGGFSQGAAMSMYVGLQYPEKLAGIVALSGYLPTQDTFHERVSDANKETAVFAAHGDRDQVVKLQYGQQAHAVIRKFNENATLKVYPYLQHSSSRAEMQAVFDFVSTCLKEE